jgi:hypothetical protein
MTHEFDQQEAGSSIYELITGLFGWPEESWIDPNYSFEKNTQKIQKLSGPLLDAKTTIDALYNAMSTKVIDKSFPDFALPLKPTLGVMPWGPSSSELAVKLFKDKKNVGRGEIRFFKEQPIDKYFVESKTNNGPSFSYPEEPRKDKLWFSYLYWKSPLKISDEAELQGEVSYIMYSFSTRPEELKNNFETSRVYALYKGVHFSGPNEDHDGVGLELRELGSGVSGFYKMKEFPHINQKFIEFRSVKLPLYTSLLGATPWIAG